MLHISGTMTWLRFMVHICKIIFESFDFLGWQGGKRTKNGLKDKNSVCHMNVIYDRHVQKNNISRHFFHFFFKVLIFQVVREVKGQTVTQNDQKLFQEAYFIGSRFLVHMCKMMVSPGHTFIFSKFWFLRCLGG